MQSNVTKYFNTQYFRYRETWRRGKSYHSWIWWLLSSHCLYVYPRLWRYQTVMMCNCFWVDTSDMSISYFNISPHRPSGLACNWITYNNNNNNYNINSVMISTYISWLKMFNVHVVQATKTIKKFNPWINETYYLWGSLHMTWSSFSSHF
mgnify:CR=1 FL=1